MPKFIRNDDHQRTDSRWAGSIFVGIMVACLLGFVASHTKGALWLFNAAQAEFAGAVTGIVANSCRGKEACQI